MPQTEKRFNIVRLVDPSIVDANSVSLDLQADMFESRAEMLSYLYCRMLAAGMCSWDDWVVREALSQKDYCAVYECWAERVATNI